jgi:hypothetical protein
VGAVIADPCGVPRSRCCKLPSGNASGAASHRFTYSTTHGSLECAATAFDDELPGNALEKLWMSKSTIQSLLQQRCRQTATASRADRFGR